MFIISNTVQVIMSEINSSDDSSWHQKWSFKYFGELIFKKSEKYSQQPFNLNV